jgi:hypothetical protein
MRICARKAKRRLAKLHARVGFGRASVVSFKQDLLLLRLGHGRAGFVATGCEHCGFVADQDWNAAKNLERLAASSAASSVAAPIASTSFLRSSAEFCLADCVVSARIDRMGFIGRPGLYHSPHS